MSGLRTHLWSLAAIATFCAGAGCSLEEATDQAEGSALEITSATPTSVSGTFTHGDSLVVFESASSDQRFATLHLEVNGIVLDAEMDVAGTLNEEGNFGALQPADQAALIGLRDALGVEHPELVASTLQGTFLSRHADWIAEAPIDYAFGHRTIDVKDRIGTTNNDDPYTTCLWPGSNYYAYYDAGNGGTQWQWYRTANSGNCLGRCGAGCNILDDDIMLDCFEHDTCLDHFGGSSLGGNSNCGDEYDHAVSEYLLTMGAFCPY